MSRPFNVNPVEWELALSMARSICADIFKKGGTPEDALCAYGLQKSYSHPNWQNAIDAVAYSNCHRLVERAA